MSMLRLPPPTFRPASEDELLDAARCGAYNHMCCLTSSGGKVIADLDYIRDRFGEDALARVLIAACGCAVKTSETPGQQSAPNSPLAPPKAPPAPPPPAPPTGCGPGMAPMPPKGQFTRP